MIAWLRTLTAALIVLTPCIAGSVTRLQPPRPTLRGMPPGAVPWTGAPNEPTEKELRIAQHRAAPGVAQCVHGAGAALGDVPVLVAFDDAGAVAWTRWDTAGASTLQCVASAVRQSMQVSAHLGRSPVMVLFPLQGTHW